MSYILPLLLAYCIWHLIKPAKSSLRTPLFGYSLDYYIFKECKPDENFSMTKYDQNLYKNFHHVDVECAGALNINYNVDIQFK